MILKYKISLFLLLAINVFYTQMPGDYELWLNYKKIEQPTVLDNYKELTSNIYFPNNSDILNAAQKEITLGVERMLDGKVNFASEYNAVQSMVIGKKSSLPTTLLNAINVNFDTLGKEGFAIISIPNKGKNKLLLTAKEDVGILYGVFRLLREMQQHNILEQVNIVDVPKIDLRTLNHWDNLDRTVERGYAGFSLWNWQKLPGYIDPRYIDYARANASIGINSTVLTNVNANALILTPLYLEKVEALANTFRPYGIKIFLTARFSAPMEIGGLETADPLDTEVQNWWKAKANEIYKRIPDFGGFLVKANSEGQPGPQNYGRTHVDGANMLATALEPHNGIVMWRAFVYSEHNNADRAKQAYDEFVPFDGSFKENVIVQSKNGPIDFQPREPVHPLFGAMPKTSLSLEFQITQEYLGFSTHLVFLPKLFEEVLDTDMYTKGKGATVSKIIDGSLNRKKLTGMAGVANIGTDLNWTGHPFAQANWYGFGRLAWDPYLSSDTIAKEWLKLTYSQEPEFIEPITKMMIDSREAVVNYMNPLGLHHIFDTGHHYGPGPWVGNLGRPDWNPTYYHNANENGIGFDRTASGSNATNQYAPELAKLYANLDTCPEEFLLWFHHLPWDYKLKNGTTLWAGLALKYQEGVDQVGAMIATWEAAKPYITIEQYEETKMLLSIQLKEAKWWRDACLLYFKTFSKRELPQGVEGPAHDLEYYKSLKFPFAPGIRPQWD